MDFLLAAGVFGDCLGSFTDGVLCQFSWQKKTYSGLHLPRSDCRSLVIVGKSRCFCCYSLEDIVDEAVHNGHCLAGNTGVGMHLSQDFVDVNCVGFSPSLPPLFLVTISTHSFGLGYDLLGSFSTNFGWHCGLLVRCMIQRVVTGNGSSNSFILGKRIEQHNLMRTS